MKLMHFLEFAQNTAEIKSILSWTVNFKSMLHLNTLNPMTQFEIELRYGGHSVTKQFMTIFKKLVAKPKSWKNLYF